MFPRAREISTGHWVRPSMASNSLAISVPNSQKNSAENWFPCMQVRPMCLHSYIMGCNFYHLFTCWWSWTLLQFQRGSEASEITDSPTCLLILSSLLYWWLVTQFSHTGAKDVQSHIAQFSSNPGKHHWDAVIPIIFHLKTTQNWVLTLGGKSAAIEILGYYDADNANSPDHSSSIS